MGAIPAATFDVGKMVFNYMVAVLLKRHYTETGHGLQIHFGGIVHGYDDWFEVLNIDQDKFDMVYDKIPRNEIKDEVERVIPIFDEQWDKQIEGKGKLILPGQSPDTAKTMMDDFKKILNQRRKK
jgi:hypothetical protein